MNHPKKNFYKLMSFLSLMAIFATFQNCGLASNQIEFSASGCIPGEKLQISLLNQNIVSDSIDIIAYTGLQSAFENYNYYSASAHPIHGPVAQDDRLNVFFYKDENGLNLNFFANLDEGGTTSSNLHVDIKVTGNSLQDGVILSDDNGELRKVGPNDYQGRFWYGRNTDGGVIGPIGINDNFKIQINFLNTGTNTEARFFSSSGNSFALQDQSGDISSFEISYRGYENCN